LPLLRSPATTPAQRKNTSASFKREVRRLNICSSTAARGAQRRLIAAALITALAGGGAAQQSARSVRDGVYSPAQAQRGERLFESICTSCHELEEFTGGGGYLELADGESLWETFDYVAAEMPEDDPGSLQPAEYAAVLAYLLRAYGLPSGTAELPADRKRLGTLTITRPAPPRS
jgi:mono/diheme cytochrome c family protein